MYCLYRSCHLHNNRLFQLYSFLCDDERDLHDHDHYGHLCYVYSLPGCYQTSLCTNCCRNNNFFPRTVMYFLNLQLHPFHTRDLSVIPVSDTALDLQ